MGKEARCNCGKPDCVTCLMQGTKDDLDQLWPILDPAKLTAVRLEATIGEHTTENNRIISAIALYNLAEILHHYVALTRPFGINITISVRKDP